MRKLVDGFQYGLGAIVGVGFGMVCIGIVFVCLMIVLREYAQQDWVPTMKDLTGAGQAKQLGVPIAPSEPATPAPAPTTTPVQTPATTPPTTTPAADATPQPTAATVAPRDTLVAAEKTQLLWTPQSSRAVGFVAKGEIVTLIRLDGDHLLVRSSDDSTGWAPSAAFRKRVEPTTAE